MDLIKNFTNSVEVRPLYDQESGTWTYLVLNRKNKEAALIDPVFENANRDLELIKELNYELKFTVETHIHADHITSSGILRKETGCETYVAKGSKADCATKFVSEGDRFYLGDSEFQVLETPGHTEHSISILLDGKYVFTGDTLLIRGCGRTDFQGGSAEDLYESISQKLFILPEETIVFPGHDYKGFIYSTIGEEKKYNLRIANKSKAEFVEIMKNLNLPYPKKIHEALPANENCGILK